MGWKYRILLRLRRGRWYGRSKSIVTMLVMLCCMNTALLKNIGLLPKEQFVALLVDLALVEAMVDTFYNNKNLETKNKIHIYNNSLVYQRHEIDQAAFQKTYEYYLQHRLHELVILYDEVEERLEKLLYSQSKSQNIS